MKSTISTDQWRELLNREFRGEFGEEGLGADVQWFADNLRIVRDLRIGAIKLAKPIDLPTTYDQFLGLTELIKRAVGKRNLGHINSDITQERFPLHGADVRQVNLRVEKSSTTKPVSRQKTADGRQTSWPMPATWLVFSRPPQGGGEGELVVAYEDSRRARRRSGALCQCEGAVTSTSASVSWRSRPQ